jgi:hypothetical protein
MAPLSAEFGDIVITNSSFVPSDTKDIDVGDLAAELLAPSFIGLAIRVAIE